MCSERELKKQLDKVPPSPYKPVADLREMHRLFHKAAEIDEGVPHSFTSVSTKEEILQLVKAISKPSKLGQALALVDIIQDEMVGSFYPEGSNLVLQLLGRIYASHNPPEKIDHQL